MGGGTLGKGITIKDVKALAQKSLVSYFLLRPTAKSLMKKFFSNRKRGVAFTLVELLVVMGIIAILAAVIIGGVGPALRAAKRAKANATAVQIQTAVQGYYTEYGVYPTLQVAANDDGYDGSTSAGGQKWAALTYTLCGNVDPYTGAAVPQVAPAPPNTRSIPYMAPVRSDLDSTWHTFRNPFYTAGTATAAANPMYFFMVVDTSYDGIVGNAGANPLLPDFTRYSTNYTGATLPNGLPGGVAVWSPCDQPMAGGSASHPSPASFWAHTY